ncbi:MAG: DUF421 domain-containing protein [Negativicutes bacterium]|nr:DUF421 domain-containing protein [Negativicutes bacterium]
MDNLGTILFRIIASMSLMLIIWLMIGQRQVGELSPADLIITIMIGSVAGAAIADPKVDLGGTLVTIALLAVIQVSLHWFFIKCRFLCRKAHYAPLVMIENGQIIKKNLRRARLPIETLLHLLRDKDVFDITEVELAILEPNGKLSVLKKAEYQPVTPQQLAIKVQPNRILVPVILEGELQDQVLKRLGFSGQQIDQFRKDYGGQLENVFVACMDQERHVHVIKEDVRESGLFPQ